MLSPERTEVLQDASLSRNGRPAISALKKGGML